MSEFKPGDKVVLAPDYGRRSDEGRVYQIVRKLDVNYLMEPVDGIGRGVKAPPQALLPAPEHLLNTVAGPRIDVGTVVALDPDVAKGAAAKSVGIPHVVTRINGATVSIKPLGGGGAGWRGIRPCHLLVLTVDQSVTTALMATAMKST